MVLSDPTSRLIPPATRVPIASTIRMSVMGWELLLRRVIQKMVPSAVCV